MNCLFPTMLRAAALVAALAVTVSAVVVVPSARLASAPYAEWAHHHWVWYNSGHNQSEIQDMVADYFSYNITVGAVDVDSGWSTGYNNFIVDNSSFPDMLGFVNGMHSKVRARWAQPWDVACSTFVDLLQFVSHPIHNVRRRVSRLSSGRPAWSTLTVRTTKLQ